jgi:hypothetical protein
MMLWSNLTPFVMGHNAAEKSVRRELGGNSPQRQHPVIFGC